MKWLVCLWFLAIGCVSLAQQPRVSATLLADHASVADGESFLVGVLFEIEPEWHIYWKNPGDAGMATTVEWSVPPGFTVSELMWPAPRQFMQAGEILGYGYEGSVMLLARVSPPEGFIGAARVGAQVRWLACKEVCIPGRSSLETTVNVGSTGAMANRETFAQWLKRVPRDLGESPLSVSVQRRGMTFELSVAGVPQAANLQVFVAPPDGIGVRSVKRMGNKAVVEFARMAGAKVSGSAEVVIGHNGVHARVLLPLE